jgi:ABC-2 type transport system permease protein
VAALTALELKLASRRGENILVTLVVPVAVLLFFGGGATYAFDDPVRRLVPGSVALAIVATGFVSLGIATAYERHYGVLKRLGGAPLPRWAFLAAKLAGVLLLVVAQVVLLAVVANLAFGWTPGPSWSPALVLLALVLGTLAFVALGLLLAGTLRAEAMLALANGMFLAFLMLGGIIVPVTELPALLQPIAAVLPVTALADLLRVAFDSIPPGSRVFDPGDSLAVLAAWALGAAVVAARAFRWD